MKHLSVQAATTYLLLQLTAVVPASAAPNAARLIGPAGEVMGSTLIFTWESVPESTWYQIWVGKSGGPAVVQRWYTADEADCARGRTCSIGLTLAAVTGTYNWFIQTWNTTGFGVWNGPLSISIKDVVPSWSRKLSGTGRFALVLDGAAVLDNETGLTWERAPSGCCTTQATWLYICTIRNTGGRRGWRLPSVAELSTLVEQGQAQGLPEGHPFDIGSVTTFWTATDWWGTTDGTLLQFSSSAPIRSSAKAVTWAGWCVRGPGGGGAP